MIWGKERIFLKRLVVALGGNALQEAGAPATAEAQLEVVRKTARYIVDLVEKGYEVILAHGNGPQVGRIVLQNEGAAHITPAMPFDVCGAMSQGMIGYHIQQAVGDELKRRGMGTPVVTLVTQVVVDRNDEAFKKPTKPIGPFYSMDEAKVLEREKGYTMKEDAGRGWRRVVASPKPVEIVELPAVKTLVEAGVMLITVGGGGIPVIKKPDGSLEGTAAVIDKDLASERLAEDIDADALVILTAVERVAINFGKADQKDISHMSVEEAERYIEEGHFAPGSMLPKVKAAVQFARSGKGRKAIISSLEKAIDALEGITGTTITA
ncbi:MAG: Carbamate kinase [Firmicutes bacterium]|nr:Carbamate kinase [Bacillota bacterium]MDI6705132.1 carbamate kinase [Bacillota bacterium]